MTKVGNAIKPVRDVDGNTAFVGGNTDNANVGAVWVWTRSISTWTQRAKLVGTGATGTAFTGTHPRQGTSVFSSFDGNMAVVGGPGDVAAGGAVWVFVRNNGVWYQQGKLTVADALGGGGLGTSVALSADGNTAIFGGPGDAGNVGAAWVFVATVPPPSSCSWSGRAFSQGAIFCIGPAMAVTCDQGRWTTLPYEPCSGASPIDAK